MIKYLSELVSHVGTAKVEDLEMSPRVDGSADDTGRAAGELIAQVYTRRVPVLHINDDNNNSIFLEHFKLSVELSEGVFGITPTFSFTDAAPGIGMTEESSGSFRRSSKKSTKVSNIGLDQKAILCKIYVSQDGNYDMGYIMKELDVLNRVYSPYVMNLYAHFESPSGHRLIMDQFYIPLRETIAKRGYSECFAASIVKQILLGVAHLHSVGVVHRDITPNSVLQNVAVPNKIVHIKLSDFGNAVTLTPSETATLFGRNYISVLGGFSSKINTSEKSPRRMFSSAPSRSMFSSTSAVPIRYSTIPESISEDRDSTLVKDKNVIQPSAEVVLHGGSGTATTELPDPSNEACQDVNPSGVSPTENPELSVSNEGEELNGSEISRERNSDCNSEKNTGNLRIINRQPLPESSAKYKYTTSIRYDSVPFKSYNKISVGLPRGEFVDYTYVAPEMLISAYGPQCDTWAVGCIAFSLLSGHAAFWSSDGADSDDMIRKIALCEYPIKGKIWRSLTELSRKFVDDLLVVDACIRSSPEEALQHPWITETTRAASHFAEHDGGEGHTNANPYNYIIAPRRESLETKLSRTTSNMTEGLCSKDSTEHDDTTEASSSGQRHSNTSRLDAVASSGGIAEQFYEDLSLGEENEFKNLMFEQF